MGEHHHFVRRMVKAEAAAHNPHGGLVNGQFVFPYDEEVAVGEHGLALETVLIEGRRIGEKGGPDRALSPDFLRQQEPSKPQERKACGKEPPTCHQWPPLGLPSRSYSCSRSP